jgi:hypothetical protein
MPASSAVRASTQMMAKSQALPFLETPAHCDGSYVGDVVRAACHPEMRRACRARLRWSPRAHRPPVRSPSRASTR